MLVPLGYLENPRGTEEDRCCFPAARLAVVLLVLHDRLQGAYHLRLSRESWQLARREQAHGQAEVIVVFEGASVQTFAVGLQRDGIHLALRCAQHALGDDAKHIPGMATQLAQCLGTCIRRALGYELDRCALGPTGMHRRYWRRQRGQVCLLQVRRCWSPHWDMHFVAGPRLRSLY